MISSIKIYEKVSFSFNKFFAEMAMKSFFSSLLLSLSLFTSSNSLKGIEIFLSEIISTSLYLSLKSFIIVSDNNYLNIELKFFLFDLQNKF